MLDLSKMNTNEHREEEIARMSTSDVELAVRREIQERKLHKEMQNTVAEISRSAENGLKAMAAATAPAPIKEASSSVVLPDSGSFYRFYESCSSSGGGCSSVSFNGEILAMKVPLYDAISISVGGIIELLADKFKEPLPIESTERTKGAPPFIEDMDNRVYNKISMIKTEFNHILAFGSPQIEKLCHDYHKTMSYPLRVHIAYLLWERSLIGFKMQQVLENRNITHAETEKAIREDYNRKLHDELSKKELVISNLKTENSRYRAIFENMNGRIAQYKEETQQLQGEIESIHNKTKAAEEKAEQAQTELQSLKQKIKEFETKNKELEARNTELIDRMMDMKDKGQSKQKKDSSEQGITSEKSDLAPTAQKILDFLDGMEPQTTTEIVDGTGIARNHVQTHLNSLLEASLITKEEDEDGGEAVFSIFIPK